MTAFKRLRGFGSGCKGTAENTTSTRRPGHLIIYATIILHTYIHGLYTQKALAMNLTGHLVVTGGLRHSHRGRWHGAARLLAERGAVGVATGAIGAKACHLVLWRDSSQEGKSNEHQ